MLSEFDIIRNYFDQPGLSASPNLIVNQGIGDDCAVITIPEGKSLVFSMDTLVERIHFPAAVSADLIASRSLAVNLSDLAAMGAQPLVFTLGLTIPESDEKWLKLFAEGLRRLALAFDCYLIGGDMSRGPLSVTIQVQGLVEQGRAILRSGARPGDKIYVTDTLGNAGLALQLFDGKLDDLCAEEKQVLIDSFYNPVPRIKVAQAGLPYVSAAIDISDGLLADLGHICRRSGCGANIQLSDVPVSALVNKFEGLDRGLAMALGAGDDYELILTVPASREAAFLDAMRNMPEKLTCIGEMTNTEKLMCFDAQGNPVSTVTGGYTHFQEHG